MPLNLTIGALTLFALVAAMTPGPNNLMLMRSGARFGIRRSTAHMLGIQCGFIGLFLLSWLGVGALLLALPLAVTLLHWACYNDSPKVKRLLLLKGADPKHLDAITLEDNPTLLPVSPFEGH